MNLLLLVSIYLENFETNLSSNEEIGRLRSDVERDANAILESGNYRLENLEDKGSDQKIKTDIQTSLQHIRRLQTLLRGDHLLL